MWHITGFTQRYRTSASTRSLSLPAGQGTLTQASWGNPHLNSDKQLTPQIDSPPGRYSQGNMHKSIVLEDLTCANFQQFGSVLDPEELTKSFGSSNANYGTAIKVSQAAPLLNLYEKSRKAKADTHINLFSCKRPPQLEIAVSKSHEYSRISYPCQVLERHPYSTQTFIPMGIGARAEAYIVIVAEPSESEGPNLSTLRAFVARGDQAVTYGQGIWHAPMVVLDRVSFAVVISENGVAADDCNEVKLHEPVHVTRLSASANL